MSGATKIQWTEKTWNPVTGCDRVSPGCDHCYAERIAERFRGSRAFPNGFDVTLHPERLEDPLHWRKPAMVFVNSMSDLFHPKVPREFVARVFATMHRSLQHTYQVLTKRPQQMARMLGEIGFGTAVDNAMGHVDDVGFPELLWPLPNVWLGTSIESDRYRFRADYLHDTDAAVRFVSAEPLLSSLLLDLTGINWVIVGCESGPGARPFDLDWARSLRDQCASTETAFFVKQLPGARRGAVLHNLEDFPEDLRIREFPA